jgi:hypothetical protein
MTAIDDAPAAPSPAPMTAPRDAAPASAKAEGRVSAP